MAAASYPRIVLDLSMMPAQYINKRVDKNRIMLLLGTPWRQINVFLKGRKKRKYDSGGRVFSFQASQRAFSQKLKYVHQYKNFSILSVIWEGPVKQSQTLTRGIWITRDKWTYCLVCCLRSNINYLGKLKIIDGFKDLYHKYAHTYSNYFCKIIWYDTWEIKFYQII